MLMSEGWERTANGACFLLLAFVHIPLVASFGIPEFLEFGQCKDVYVDPNINFERFSGIWFSIEHVPNEYSPVDSCTLTNYTWQGDHMTVKERGLTSEGEKVQKNSAMRLTEGQPGVLTVEAEGVPSAPYLVVSTDFDNYACIYSCLSMMGFRASFSWILARVPSPNDSYVVLCRGVLEEHGISPDSLSAVGQGENCPYMERLDSILTYTQDLQRKVKLREQEEIEGVKEASEGSDATQAETPLATTRKSQKPSASDSQNDPKGKEEDPGRKAAAEEQVSHDPMTAERTTTVSGGSQFYLSVITVFLSVFVTSRM